MLLSESLGAAHPSYPTALPHTPVGRLLVGPLQVVLAAQVALHLHAVPVVHLGRQRCRLFTLAQRRVQDLIKRGSVVGLSSVLDFSSCPSLCGPGGSGGCRSWGHCLSSSPCSGAYGRSTPCWGFRARGGYSRQNWEVSRPHLSLVPLSCALPGPPWPSLNLLWVSTWPASLACAHVSGSILTLPLSNLT